ncbi:hypothetical protein GUJ93_ZPchr0181g29098 [Zizania palustris]|uniref:ABC transporter domain-containing protein n=1 Tax=Zizania palustris TaxID=103762 RepID=A0A8J5UXS8_ZIZPA|nr:hypothetical protein GUJ93_ZPchr0181g29098 [Zizania palustris]
MRDDERLLLPLGLGLLVGLLSLAGVVRCQRTPAPELMADMGDDWNGAFNYTSDLGFVQDCLNETQGYKYQITPNTTGCGGADTWADLGPLKICSAQPVTIVQHQQRRDLVLMDTTADGFTTEERRVVVLLVIIYNCSGQFLTIREKRKARSRENAIQLARQQIKAHEGWKAAKQLARKHVSGMQSHISRTFSRSRRSFRQQPDGLQEAPLFMGQELSDSAAFSAGGTHEISEVNPSVAVDLSSDGGIVAGKDRAAPKGKHRSTNTQIFKYAYGEIEKEKKKLLRSINGELWPGRVTAVMGPSGAGKTTFLNAVTGKVAGYKVSGSVLVNGRHDNIRSYKKIIGFVPQDDVVHGNLTVEENLWFSAKCRLSATASHRHKVLTVERVIDSLDLQGVRSSLVGTVEKRGISGGQRKRVNVGIEMVMEPSLLILDEPTSGLDSSSSQLLLRALRHEALEGVNVCAVVHQPSYTLYNMFDDLILLAKGGFIVYNGPVKTVEDHFRTLGIHVPERVNPPDHYIDILEGIVKPESGINASIYHCTGCSAMAMKCQMTCKMNSRQWVRHAFAVERDRIEQHLSKPKDLSSRRTPGVISQYKYYLGRVTKQRLREARLLSVAFLYWDLPGSAWVSWSLANNSLRIVAFAALILLKKR